MLDQFLPLSSVLQPPTPEASEPKENAFVAPPLPSDEPDLDVVLVDLEHSSGSSGSPKFFCIIA